MHQRIERELCVPAKGKGNSAIGRPRADPMDPIERPLTATLERVKRNLKRYQASVLKAAVEGLLVPAEAELARTMRGTTNPPPPS